MAAEDDEAEEKADDLAQYAEFDPTSGQRAKRTTEMSVQLLLADFRRRIAGLTDEEVQEEVDRLVGKIIERHTAASPQSLKPEVRETLKRMIESDPAIAAMLEDLRAAAGRESR